MNENNNFLIYKNKEGDIAVDAILKNKGNISHEKALKKAHEEYDKYMISHLTRAEKDYLKALNLDIKEINR